MGDYAKDTAHLGFLEDAAYTRALRVYYLREKPLPVEVRECERLIRAVTRREKEAVTLVLTEFFELQSDGWHNKRADEEIQQYQAQAATNRRIAQQRTVKRTVNEPSTNHTPSQNHKPEPLAKDQKLPSADADPWLAGKEFLIKRGVTPSTVGGFIGKLVKDHGHENVVNALQAAIVNEPADVKSYIVGALRGKQAKFDPVASNLAFIRGQS